MGVYRRGRIWYIRYEQDKQVKRESTRQESKSLAEKILRKRRTDVAEGRSLETADTILMTFNELADWYWHQHGRFKKSHGVQGMVDRLKSHFGSRHLMAITPESVDSYRRLRRENGGVTERTVNRDLQELKGMFNKVIRYKRWRGLLENPVSYLELAKERNERVRFLDRGEITRLLANCGLHLRPIVFVALHTGMRRGEIFNLRWSAVDFARNTIRVEESKNGEGRHIPMSTDLRSVLQCMPSRPIAGLVFPSPVSDVGSLDGQRRLVHTCVSYNKYEINREG